MEHSQPVMSGLIRKRAEIAGQLEDAQTRVLQLIIDVDSVDAVLRQFDLDVDLEVIRPSRCRRVIRRSTAKSPTSCSRCCARPACRSRPRTSRYAS